LNQPVAPPEKVPATLEEIRGLRLIEVSDPEHLRIWNELMIGEHPLQECRLVGRQLRYLVGSEHGWLGGMGFGSAALQLEGRDDWIGWNHQQRSEHLERVLNMSRFLIRPSVRCPHLASHLLGLCARRVGGDFERRYGVRPWLLESFVETPAYEGICYQAANWIQAGQTKGRGRNGSHKASKSIKDVYLYPLVNDFGDRVGVKPVPIQGLPMESGLASAGWAGQEFGSCDLGDDRLTERLVKILQPELRSDLCCRKSKTQLLSARINVRQRRGIGLKAELGRRHRNKRHVGFHSANGKGRSSENFLSLVSDTATCRIQRVTESQRICKRPDRNRLPHRNSVGGSDWNWRPVCCRGFPERQVILQDISRRALRAGFAREQDDERGAEHRNKRRSATVPSRRTIWYGVATDFLASSSVHGNLSCARNGARSIQSDNCFNMVAPRSACYSNIAFDQGILRSRRCRL
jgi:hypothetical protein